MIKVDTVIVFDQDSHRYRIPKSMEEEFCRTDLSIQELDGCSDEFYTACEEFTEKFGHYRVDGQ